jgi:hypothetical protein
MAPKPVLSSVKLSLTSHLSKKRISSMAKTNPEKALHIYGLAILAMRQIEYEVDCKELRQMAMKNEQGSKMEDTAIQSGYYRYEGAVANVKTVLSLHQKEESEAKEQKHQDGYDSICANGLSEYQPSSPTYDPDYSPTSPSN